uniref:Uncharacterized protein n=1 Tax=Anguilla anguilla TaxID=7936 RepID=A0A0E9UQY5_ANGAN
MSCVRLYPCTEPRSSTV